MAGLLTSVAGDKDKSALYLSECRRMGIKVLPPDVNASNAIFTPVGTDIRFGMAAVRNVGTNVVESIVGARTSKGAFTSFSDFLRKVPVNVCNKRVIESLVKAGAFDSFGHPRRGLMLIHEQAVDAIIDVKRNEAIGQDSLFGDDTEDGRDLRRADPRRRVGEGDAAGVRARDARPVRVRPSAARRRARAGRRDRLLARAAARLGRRRAGAQRGTRGDRDAQVVTVGGILSGVQRKVTRQGSTWAAATLEDLEGAIEVLFFPATYAQCMSQIIDDAIVVVRGRLDRREEVPKLVAMEVSTPDITAGETGPFVVSMLEGRCVPPVVERLKEVCGPTPARLRCTCGCVTGNRIKVLRLDDKLRVKPSPSLLADLKQLLGPGCVG